jgi:hypothetical protein
VQILGNPRSIRSSTKPFLAHAITKVVDLPEGDGYGGLYRLKVETALHREYVYFIDPVPDWCGYAMPLDFNTFIKYPEVVMISR